jgi:hypothetical protein
MHNKSGLEDSMPTPQLADIQPARGWRVIHHRLFQLRPDQADQVVITKKGFSVWDLYFLQDLILAENASEKLLLDVGWYPHADPSGSFRMLVVRQLPDSNSTEISFDWEHPLEDVETRSVDELLSRIHSIVRKDE